MKINERGSLIRGGGLKKIFDCSRDTAKGVENGKHSTRGRSILRKTRSGFDNTRKRDVRGDYLNTCDSNRFGTFAIPMPIPSPSVFGIAVVTSGSAPADAARFCAVFIAVIP